MNVVYSKKFVKQYKKLSPKLKDQTKSRIALWESSPNDPLLRLHRLKGELEGYYSINITGDIRAIYEVIGGDTCLYQMIGSHSQLYK